MNRLSGVRISFFVYPYPLVEKTDFLDGVQEAPQMIKPMDWSEVKEYFSREVPGLLKKL